MSDDKRAIDYDCLKQTGQGFQGQAGNMSNALRALQSKTEVLNGGGWIGKGQKSFAQDMDKVFQAFKKLIDALNMAGECMNKVGQTYQQGEQESQNIVITINVNTGG